MSDERTKYYKVVNQTGSNRALHTDPDCDRLQYGKDYRQVFRDQFPNADICQACAGTMKSPTEQDHSLYWKIRRAAEADD